ncbi:MAG: sensor histidine kinase [Christensenellaceae bacterium]|jgi:two-component system sensor histidine kinase CiaH
MIKKLQNRFTLITMLVLTTMFVLLFVFVFFVVSSSTEQQTERVLDHIAQNDGRPDTGPPVRRNEGFPPPGGINMSNEDLSKFSRYFSVKVDSAGTVIESGSNTEGFFEDEQVYEYAMTALSRGNSAGHIGNFQYVVREKDYGKIIVFADKTFENNMQAHFFTAVFFITCGAIVVLFFVVRKLSAFAIRPAKDAFEQQKRFVSDASHELKTPISIISANADVLSGDIGESKWLDNIRQQANRMDVLVRQLLNLSKMDEQDSALQQAPYNLSEEAANICLSYESMAYENEIAYTYHIQEGLSRMGDPEDIRKLLTVFLDNAFQYSGSHGKVRAEVTRHKKNISIQVFNTGEGISAPDQQKIFERFYRKDPSRSQKTGGYGLGLSIAQGIVEKYGGEIGVESVPGEWAMFTAVI